VFQVAEKVAAQQLKPVRLIAERLRTHGFEFAIEHFGVGPRPAQILSHVPMDYVKIDGSLMQGLARDVQLQATVGELVTQAKENGIRTIAERVEDANTMATLWQLGIEFIQGYQVQEPEVVLAEEAGQHIQR
jgi:EAL domain-containing protein (putative c-di-GMP-specific phosphodiesterase class I)